MRTSTALWISLTLLLICSYAEDDTILALEGDEPVIQLGGAGDVQLRRGATDQGAPALRVQPNLNVDGSIHTQGTVKANLLDVPKVDVQNLNVENATASTASIGSAAVGSSTIATANIQSAPITAASITTANIQSAPVANQDVTTSTITTANIDSAPITAAAITTANIASAPITAASITTANIASAPVTNMDTGSQSVGSMLVSAASTTNSSVSSMKVEMLHVSQLLESAAPVTLSAPTIPDGVYPMLDLIRAGIKFITITAEEYTLQSIDNMAFSFQALQRTGIVDTTRSSPDYATFVTLDTPLHASASPENTMFHPQILVQGLYRVQSGPWVCESGCGTGSLGALMIVVGTYDKWDVYHREGCHFSATTTGAASRASIDCTVIVTPGQFIILASSRSKIWSPSTGTNPAFGIEGFRASLEIHLLHAL